MITEQFRAIQSEIPANVKLIAVSKTFSVAAIQQVYDLGQRDFGENKVQELLEKYPHLPKDIRWHLIGHLQRNKVKYIAPFIDLIHSVDSLKLLQEIDSQALKNKRVIQCMLQFHVAQEETKFGFTREEAIAMLDSSAFKALKNIQIVGVMGMASFSNDRDLIRNEFKKIVSLFNFLKETYFSESNLFCERSMGMSSDFKIAIEEGSTLVRVGSLLFGRR
jgi:pyridoxal phosphate enzyme (YggS family)